MEGSSQPLRVAGCFAHDRDPRLTERTISANRDHWIDKFTKPVKRDDKLRFPLSARFTA